MNKYGTLACLAATTLQNNKATPTDAWKTNAFDVFPHSSSSRKKSCPKNAFLGLAEAGLLNGFELLNNSRSANSVNKDYALKMYELILNDITLLEKPKELWSKALDETKKTQNQQVEVVISLWKEGFLKDA